MVTVKKAATKKAASKKAAPRKAASTKATAKTVPAEKSAATKAPARKVPAKTAPWDRDNPKAESGEPTHPLTPAQKASARRAAKEAGRPYPNLVDNMQAARKKT